MSQETASESVSRQFRQIAGEAKFEAPAETKPKSKAKAADEAPAVEETE